MNFHRTTARRSLIRHENSAMKRRVALQSMLAASCMTALKLAAGLISGLVGRLVGRGSLGTRPGRIRYYVLLRSRFG